MADAGLPLPGDSEAPSFSAFFPPPYRVLLLVSIGLLLSASNFQLLGRKGIDLWILLRSSEATAGPAGDGSGDTAASTHSQPSSRREKNGILPTTAPTLSSSPDNRSVSSSGLLAASPGERSSSPFYLAGFCGLAWSLLGWFSYRFYVDRLDGDPRGRHAQALQGVAMMGAVGALLWPGNVLNRAGRKAFGRALLRILSPSLSQDITFADVLLADVLTSLAKVFGDVWLTACFLVPRAEHHTWWNGKGSIAVPLLISLPYAIRLRQCVSEYIVTNARAANGSTRELTGRRGKSPAPTTNKKPLWNAAKYASAFPVIWLSVWYEADKVAQQPGEWNALYNLWLLSVFINSLFSFYWDVTNDWGLSVLSPSALASASHAGGEGTSHILGSGTRLQHRRGVSSFSFLQHHGYGKEDSLPSERVPLHRMLKEDGSHRQLGAVITSLSSSSSAAATLAAPETTHHYPPRLTAGIASASHVPAHERRPSLLEKVLRPAVSSSSSSLMFHPYSYQLAILVDLVLRFFWSLKLSSHLHHVVEWQGGVFVMEALEILRRWIWVFFRVEWETVRQSRVGHYEHHANDNGLRRD